MLKTNLTQRIFILALLLLAGCSIDTLQIFLPSSDSGQSGNQNSSNVKVPANWKDLGFQKRDSRLDSSIHMLFVSFDLNVIWINSNMQIVDKIIAKSWRPAYLSKPPARYVLEIHPERWDDYEIGDGIQFKDA